MPCQSAPAAAFVDDPVMAARLPQVVVSTRSKKGPRCEGWSPAQGWRRGRPLESGPTPVPRSFSVPSLRGSLASPVPSPCERLGRSGSVLAGHRLPLLGAGRQRATGRASDPCLYRSPGARLPYGLHTTILPKFLRVACSAVREGELDLSNLGLGDQQLAALLADGDLVPTARIACWRLRDARLSGAGVAALAEALPRTTEALDLASNHLGAAGTGCLTRLMADGGLPGLRKLNLSSCGIRGDALVSMLKELGRSSVLLSLELNHNDIQEGVAVGGFVANHPQLMRLSLHCNRLSSNGCTSLFKGVLTNARQAGQLAFIDVAWNGVSSTESVIAGRAIAAVLRESVTLYHLDLSYNGMGLQCCACIAEALRGNHFLFGLHIVGNAATMDADGFLFPQSNGTSVQCLEGSVHASAAGKLDNCYNVVANSPDVRSASISGKRPADDGLRERDVLEQQSSCWACEGWERVELEWPIDPAEPVPCAVWAFTSLDGFRAAFRLQRWENQPRFAAARMVPPGCRLLVIFQVDSALRVPPAARAEPLDPPADIELRASAELPELRPPEGQELVEHRRASAAGDQLVEHRLVLRARRAAVLGPGAHARPPAEVGAAGQRIVLFDGPGGGPPVAMPRVVEAHERMKSKPVPVRSAPFYRGFRAEDEAVLRKCLQADWSHAKVGRLVPEDQRPGVLEVLERHYAHIFALYKYFSALDVTGQSSFGVSQLQACNIMIGAGVVDDLNTKIADIDRLFIAANVVPVELRKDFAASSDKALNRFQFVEFLLRVARQHFVEPRPTTTMAEAVAGLLEALAPAGGARAAEQRACLAALRTEALDALFRRRRGLLRAAYEHFGSRECRRGRASFMPLAGFQDLLERAEAYDPEFQPRKAAVAFRMGMMPEVDEVHSLRFEEMSFLEFQHAIGAVAFLRVGCCKERVVSAAEKLLSTNLAAAVQSVRKAKPGTRTKTLE